MRTDEQAVVVTTNPTIPAQRERWFVILYRPGPTWTPGKPLVEQRISAHLAYMDELCRQGSIASAGGFLDAESGGMLLMHAPHPSAAQAVVDNDPAVRDGIFVGTARPFYPMFGAATGAAPDAAVIREVIARASSSAAASSS